MKNEDTWELLDDSVLRESPPLLNTNKRGLFQRINLQRATYFADVENGREGSASQSGVTGNENHQSKAGSGDSQESQDRKRQLPSDFADLSTWCCDAFAPASASLTSWKDQGVRMVPLVDQPTVQLSLLDSAPTHLADIPTVPNLPVVSVSVVRSKRSAGKGASPKTRGKLTRFWRSLWQIVFRGKCCARRSRKEKPVRPKERELLLERLHERRQRGTSLTTLPRRPGGRRTPLSRPPTDRLFG